MIFFGIRTLNYLNRFQTQTLLIALLLNFGLIPRKEPQISSCPNGKFIEKKYALHSNKKDSIAL